MTRRLLVASATALVAGAGRPPADLRGAEMTDRPHGMCQYPGRPVPGPAWPRHEPARRPATDGAERPESPRPQGGTPERSEALSGGFATGGPIPGSRGDDRIPYRLGENGCGPSLTAPASGLYEVTATVAPPRSRLQSLIRRYLGRKP